MRDILVEVHNLLIKRRRRIAVAESCTGGGLSNLLTRLPGSSGYFILGVIVYSNKAKEDILNIPSSLIFEKGAVSKEVAQHMARSIRSLARTDFGLGITGIAGPSPTTPCKPKGTVFIAVDSKTKKICKRYHFRGNRLAVRNSAALKALELLKSLIKSNKHKNQKKS